MHVAIITAGGAGMFCGSCMHDNTWARALLARGAEVSLIPAYTPIRVDEENLSAPQVFLGGINIYLDYRVPLWRKLPRALTRWLDTGWLINLVSRFAVSNNARELGALTLAMLAGEEGPSRREIDELADFVAGLRADVVCFSNALLVGALRRLKDRSPRTRVYCLLQGDDVFLDDLPDEFRGQALERIRERAVDFEGFLVHSRYYRDFMSEYLNIPREKFHQIPLGIDLERHDGTPTPRGNAPFTVGYFARICPEKGLHQLVEAFERLHGRYPERRLVAGGYLGPRDRAYFRDVSTRARRLGAAFTYVGSPPTHEAKVDFLKSLHVLCVPTVYHEPKGLYVLEALANGVPVVEPRHGAFPELIETTGGGILFEPGDSADLARALEELMHDEPRRLACAAAGQAGVREGYSADTMARATLSIFQKLEPVSATS